MDAGETSAPEMLRAEIEYERAITETERAEQELTQARKGLATLIGVNSLSGKTLVRHSPEKDQVELSDLTAKNLLVDHPKVSLAKLEIDKVSAVAERVRKETLPDFTVEAGFGRRDSELEGSENLAEFSISIPLPLVNRGQGTEETAEGLYTAAEAERDATIQSLEEEVQNTLTQVIAAEKRVRRYQKEILPKVEQALGLMQRGFQEGKFRFIDLLDTQRTLVEMRLNYQEAMLERNVARATLDIFLQSQFKNSKE